MRRLLLALCPFVLAGCPQSLAGFGPGEDAGTGLPPNRDVLHDAGAPDGGTPPGEDAGGGPGPTPDDAGPSPDAGPGGATCVTWEDCPPHFGDPNSGYACVDEQCVCDPDVTLAQGCSASGGYWDAATCHCDFLDDDAPAACTVWQDCPPHYESLQSGYECVDQQCVCDPNNNQYQTNCTNDGGYWIPQECFCAFSDVAPPNQAPEPDCWWHLEEPPCDPDRWVDTSHYETECHYEGDEYICEQVWVEEGHYEDGACPSPYWEQRCYG